MADVKVTSTVNNVYPPRPSLPLPHKDAREYALEALRDFILALEFRRTGSKGTPDQSIGFRLPRDSVHIYQPDDPRRLNPPAVGVVHQMGEHVSYGLGPPEVIDDSFGVFSPGTALLRAGEYVEPVIIEPWGSKHAERRAMVAGLKQVFRSSDQSYSLRLKLPRYFNQVAQFSLNNSMYIDGFESILNRRRANLMLEMRVCEVFLVQVTELEPRTELKMLDGNLFLDLNC